MSTKTAVQIKIVLKNSKPPIWRRVLVDSAITFEELHYTIQLSMGWGIYHLYEFKVDGYKIGVIDEEMDDYGFGASEMIDSEEITLEEIISKGINKFTYEYDFGDSWDHSIEIEKTMPQDPEKFYPVCLKGSMNCPPEDVGGIPGFYYLLEVLKDPTHPEHEELQEWVGGEYDPEDFDLEETNFFLREIGEIMESDEDEDYYPGDDDDDDEEEDF
jgi:hypothetical protein